MNKNKCKGCNSLTEKIQINFFKDNNVVLLDKLIKSIQPYCTYHGLHLSFLDRIYKNNDECPHFYNF